MEQKLQIEVINSFDNVVKVSYFCLDRNWTIVDMDGIDDIYFEHKETNKELGLHFNGNILTISMGELKPLLNLYEDLSEFIKNNCDK
jgi:hypothetical protein